MFPSFKPYAICAYSRLVRSRAYLGREAIRPLRCYAHRKMPSWKWQGFMAENRPSVFLDTNVVLSYLNGRLPWLFDNNLVRKFRYAINPVVFQEVVLRG